MRFKTNLNATPMLSREQQFLFECFGGSEILWGSGRDLPILHRTLTSGGGLIKNGDVDRETAQMFGLRLRR